MEIDKLDEAILRALCQNARMPTTQLAKKVRASREVVTYRMHRLEKEGIIRGYVTEIPYENLGFIGAALLLSVKRSNEKQLEAYITSKTHFAWIARWTGFWTHGMSVIGKTLAEIDAHVQALLKHFAGAVRDSKVLVHKESTFAYEKMLGGVSHAKRANGIDIDAVDKQILGLLGSEARMDATEIAKRVGISAVAIANRIKKLEKTGAIARFTVFLDAGKLGLQQYSVWIENKNVQERARLLSLLRAHPHVHMLFEYVGEQQIEFCVFTKDAYTVRDILMHIEEAFPDNRVLDVHSLHEDLLSVAPPPILFAKDIK